MECLIIHLKTLDFSYNYQINHLIKIMHRYAMNQDADFSYYLDMLGLANCIFSYHTF